MVRFCLLLRDWPLGRGCWSIARSPQLLRKFHLSNQEPLGLRCQAWAAPLTLSSLPWWLSLGEQERGGRQSLLEAADKALGGGLRLRAANGGRRRIPLP